MQIVIQQMGLESVHKRSSLECLKEIFGSSFHSVTMYMSKGIETWESLIYKYARWSSCLYMEWFSLVVFLMYIVVWWLNSGSLKAYRKQSRQ